MSDIRVAYTDGSPAAEEFVNKMREWEDSYNLLRRAWIAELRAQGVSAAHPDDGWVNRNDNILYPVYPDFNDGIEVGSTVALGDHRKHRLVRVTATERNFLNPKRLSYHFEEVSE